VLLGSHYENLREYEPMSPQLVVRGASERLAPTLAATIAMGLAVLPFVLLGDIAGLELLQPMAVVVLGGLVTSTLVALFVVPALYPAAGSRAIDTAVEIPKKPDVTGEPEPAVN
jgi:Cu/Ag efflux pump CusA